MPEKFKDAWSSYINVCNNFLGTYRSDDYKDVIQKMVKDFQNQGCLMSIKLHYIDKNLDKFPSNCGLMPDQQGERFHNQLFYFERIYNKSFNGLRM